MTDTSDSVERPKFLTNIPAEKPGLPPDFGVGSPVIVISGHRYARETGTVTKKGRIWIEVDAGYRGRRFRMDTQNDDRGYGVSARFLTPEQEAWEQTVNSADQYLRDQRLVLDYQSPWYAPRPKDSVGSPGLARQPGPGHRDRTRGGYIVKTITLEQLVEVGACLSARRRFIELFGTSVEVTEELAVQHAHDRDLDFDWIAGSLFRGSDYDAYDVAVYPATKAYNDVSRAALKDHATAVDAAHSAFKVELELKRANGDATAMDAARWTRVKAIHAATAVYDDAVRPEREAYNEACARAFAQVYLNMSEPVDVKVCEPIPCPFDTSQSDR